MRTPSRHRIATLLIVFCTFTLTNLRAQAPIRFDRFYPQDAFLVTIAQKSQLQSLLDLHKVIRLEPGDYQQGNSLTGLLVKSNYRIYGIGTTVPKITIEPGTENAVVSSVHATLIFPTHATAITKHNLFRRLTYGQITVTNAMVENNFFFDLSWNGMDIDTRLSGYFKNNRILRFVSQVDRTPANPVIRFRGDENRKSGGNIMVAGTFLGAPANYFDNQFGFTLLCPTNEAYSTADDPFLQTGRMGKFTVWQAAGLNSSGRSFVSDADEAVIFGFDQNTQKAPLGIFGPNQSASMYMGSVLPLAGIVDQATTAFRVYGMDGGNEAIKTVRIDGKDNPTSISPAQADKVRSMLMKAQGPAWEIPTFDPIANPGGVDWSLNRDKKISSSAELQARINAEGLVMLPKGIYYLDKPLILGRRSKGLLGAGQDQTVLIAMRPDMNLIEMDSIPLNDPEATGLTLTDLTLQGGKNGIYQKWRGGKNLQFYDCLVSHVTFRDMSESGFQFTDIYAWDNNIFDDLTFYKCASGFKQLAIVQPGQNDASPTLNYMDKVTFLHCRFVDCGKALDILTGRASGGNWFMNCRFEGNSEYVWRANHYPVNFLNCDFVGNAGSPVIHNYGPLAVTGCRFENGLLSSSSFVNSSSSLVVAESIFKGSASTTITPITPSSFLATTLTNPDNFRHYRDRRFFFFNSVSSVPIGGIRNGMFFNNTFEKDTAFAKEWVNLVDSSTVALMAEKAHPAPQLLAGAIFPLGLSSGGGSAIRSPQKQLLQPNALEVIHAVRQGNRRLHISFKLARTAVTEGQFEAEIIGFGGARIGKSHKVKANTSGYGEAYFELPVSGIFLFHIKGPTLNLCRRIAIL